jgi:peptide-methionine (S)-S-oxide reductase
VGYAGGTKRNPSYHNLGDHTETIQIEYDPERISYEKLLDIFWQSHDPESGSPSRQYMTAVFFHNETQQRLAMESKERVAATLKVAIKTQILPYNGFTPAEDYHQKFHLRDEYTLMEEFRHMYPHTVELVASTAAARVNGYLGGYGTMEELKKELESYGLSEAGKTRLLDIVEKSGHRREACPLP